jgi:pimeloyl-ACP methyl ester carboxylesterase
MSPTTNVAHSVAVAFQRILYVITVLLALAGSARAASERVVVTAGTKAGVTFDRGTLYVPENRAVPGSRTIAIGFARLRSAHPDRPPIFFLYGGPGASYLDAFDATTANADRRFALLRRYAEVADVVVLDQRGFSKRGTTLVLPATPPVRLDRPSSLAARIATWTAIARGAAAANPGHDLRGYTIEACAADVDALRRALGYRQLVLLGGSFGSQQSFAVMRLFPAIVARAVLVAVEPLDNGFDMPAHVFAALQRIAADADRAPALQPYLPSGGLVAAVRGLRERFARGPVTVQVGAKSIVLGLEDFQRALTAHDAASWPAFVLALHHGHYEDWARAELADREAPPFDALINPLIDAGIGVSPLRRRLLEGDPAIELLGTSNFAPHLATRGVWPAPDLTDALRAPVKSTIPIVLVSGDWDTSTPIENLQSIAPYWVAGRAIIVHRGEHDQLSYQTRTDPAAFAAILAFLATGATAQLPVEVTLPAPTFVVPKFPAP